MKKALWLFDLWVFCITCTKDMTKKHQEKIHFPVWTRDEKFATDDDAATNPQQYNTHVNITNSSRVFEEDQLDNKFGKL
jgi:hypothetical protein